MSTGARVIALRWARASVGERVRVSVCAGVRVL